MLIVTALQEYADVQLTAVLATLTKSAVALNDVRWMRYSQNYNVSPILN